MIGATTHAASYCADLPQALDRAAETTGVNFVGGFSALVQKGFAKGDEILMQSIPEALAVTKCVLFFGECDINEGWNQSGRGGTDGAHYKADRRNYQGARLNGLCQAGCICQRNR